MVYQILTNIKRKKTLLLLQDDTMYAYKACIVVPQQKWIVFVKIKIYENKKDYNRTWK